MDLLPSTAACNKVGGRLTVDRWFADQGTPLGCDLARSGAASMSVGELLEVTGTGSADLLDLPLDYGPGRGGARVAAAIRASLGAGESASVVVAGGAVEALLLLCLGTADRGDVVIGTPAYGALLSAPAAAARSLRLVSVWNPVAGLHLDAIAASVTPATGMVVINSPHNPSGASASLDEIDELADRCAANGALLVVDEVARGTLNPDAPSAVHSHGFAVGTTVVLGDVSKSLGLGGLRIGWLAMSDAGLAARAATAKDATTVASSTLSEYLAAIALENAPLLLRRVTSEARTNLASLSHFLATMGDGERWTPPADGLVAFPAVSSRRGIDELVADLRRRDVGVVPGWLFGEPNRLRLGLGGAPAMFSEALARAGEVLAR